VSTTNEQWDIVSGIGITAVAVAAGRAIETKRDDRLIEDPYAESLVHAADAPMPLTGSSNDPEVNALLQSTADYMGLRSRFFDDWFRQAWTDGARQAVILASGLDTRAFRLSWPDGFRVFEIDQPKVLEFKDTVLDGLNVRPNCERHAVPVDLRDDWASALEAAGFDTELPTAWLAEGLLPYLPAAAEEQLIATIHRFSAAGSHIAIESVAGARSKFLTDERVQKTGQQFGFDFVALLSPEDRPDPADGLAERGWIVRKESTNKVATRLQRELGGVYEQMGEFSEMLTARLPH
jgi:methyltransferase (TIGR00027 family)